MIYKCFSHKILTYIIALIWTFGIPSASHSQKLPQDPYQLSEAVQAKAKELKVWQGLTKDYSYLVSALPAIQVYFYLDELAAVDVMAKERARHQGRKEPRMSDYDMMFATTCRFIPNKPITHELSIITKTYRKKFVGIYLNSSKRKLLVTAMKPVLLKGSMNDLFEILKKIRKLDDFNSNVLNTKLLER